MSILTACMRYETHILFNWLVTLGVHKELGKFLTQESQLFRVCLI